MLTGDTPVEQPILIIWACAPFIFVINKDVVSLVAATYGPYNAGNAEESTPMSETPVLMGWRRCDLTNAMRNFGAKTNTMLIQTWHGKWKCDSMHGSAHETQRWKQAG